MKKSPANVGRPTALRSLTARLPAASCQAAPPDSAHLAGNGLMSRRGRTDDPTVKVGGEQEVGRLALMTTMGTSRPIVPWPNLASCRLRMVLGLSSLKWLTRPTRSTHHEPHATTSSRQGSALADGAELEEMAFLLDLATDWCKCKISPPPLPLSSVFFFTLSLSC